MVTGTDAGAPQGPQSIHCLVPEEQGGVRARRGLIYQDHVAAGFFITMLCDAKLDAVWCEVEDDITLIWKSAGSDAAEFVQVKSDQQKWTIGKICGRTKARDARQGPRSLLEKSLAHDRCSEACTFRVVTEWPLDPLLGLLREAIDSVARRAGSLGIERLVVDIAAKAQPESESPFLSANGHGPEYWVRNVIWQEAGPQEAVDNANRRQFERFLESTGRHMSIDLRDELYDKLLFLAEKSASAPIAPDIDAKKTRRDALVERLKEQINQVSSGGQAPDEALRERLDEAGADGDLVAGAIELRRQYGLRRRTPTYLAPVDIDTVEQAVLGRLHQLRVAWNAGSFDDTPAQFLHRCIESVEAMRVDMPPSVSDQDLVGLLYDITGRGRHRFTKYAGHELLSNRAGNGSEAA